MDRDIIRQSAIFWNSPWAMSSTWENGRDTSARFFVEDAALVVELELAGAGPWSADAHDTELVLHSGRSQAGDVRVPLPHPVAAQRFEHVALTGGRGRLALTRQGAEPLS